MTIAFFSPLLSFSSLYPRLSDKYFRELFQPITDYLFLGRASSWLVALSYLSFTKQIHIASMRVVFLAHNSVSSHSIFHDAAIFIRFLPELNGEFRGWFWRPSGREPLSHLCVLTLFFVHRPCCLWEAKCLPLNMDYWPNLLVNMGGY